MLFVPSLTPLQYVTTIDMHLHCIKFSVFQWLLFGFTYEWSEEKKKIGGKSKKYLRKKLIYAVNVDRTRDLQIFSLTLSQLSYPRC